MQTGSCARAPASFLKRCWAVQSRGCWRVRLTAQQLRFKRLTWAAQGVKQRRAYSPCGAQRSQGGSLRARAARVSCSWWHVVGCEGGRRGEGSAPRLVLSFHPCLYSVLQGTVVVGGAIVAKQGAAVLSAQFFLTPLSLHPNTHTPSTTFISLALLLFNTPPPPHTLPPPTRSTANLRKRMAQAALAAARGGTRGTGPPPEGPALPSALHLSRR